MTLSSIYTLVPAATPWLLNLRHTRRDVSQRPTASSPAPAARKVLCPREGSCVLPRGAPASGPLSPAVTRPPAASPQAGMLFLGAAALSPCPCNVLSQVSIPRALSLPSSKAVISSPVKPSQFTLININSGSQQFLSSSPTLGSSTEILFLYSLHMYSVYCLSSPTKIYLP